MKGSFEPCPDCHGHCVDKIVIDIKGIDQLYEPSTINNKANIQIAIPATIEVCKKCKGSGVIKTKTVCLGDK